MARLGSGGQAELFRVGDPLLARELALKLGRRPFDADSPAERDDLVREARTLAALRHDGLVNVHTLGFLEDGRPYLVLDLVLGTNLDEHVGAGRLDPRRAAEVVERLALVVEHLHACGVLHLDIKPRNVMIDEHGQPRLIDLGLARLRYAWAPEPDVPAGGTPAYLAPEQAGGEVERVGRATDVFGLGGVLYFLLTGRALYEGASHDEVMAQARRGKYGAKALEDAAAPQELKEICKQALALAPADRYSSAGALAIDLKGFREQEKPNLDRSGGVRRWVIAVGSALAALVVLGAIWAMATRVLVGDAPRDANGAAATDPPVAPSRSVDGSGEGVVYGTDARSNPRVRSFEIHRQPNGDEENFKQKSPGILGRSTFAAHEGDELTVRAELSEPAHAYLIAFRPDGTDELCDPDDESAWPPRKQQPGYPPPSKSGERYGLAEGAGLYAFALVVSRKPLPPYDEWKRRVGPIPWSARLPCEPGVVWRDDDAGLEPLVAGDPDEIRGKGVKAGGSGASVAKLASWLRGLPDVDVVTVEAFPVEPATRP